MLDSSQIKLLSLLGEISAQQNLKIYLVGGLVRDLFLGHSLLDIDLDLVLENGAREFAEACQARLGGRLKEYKDFLTIKLCGFTGFGLLNEIDFALVRREIYEKPGALPCVRQASNIREDLQRRDFSVNALALPLDALLAWLQSGQQGVEALYPSTIDLFGGLTDLKAALIRVLHEKSFEDDPTRILRASRYLARLSGQVEPGTERLLREALKNNALDTVSRFRKFSEIKKIMFEANAGVCLEILQRFGVWSKLGIQDSAGASTAFSALCELAKLKLKLRDELHVQLIMLCIYDWSETSPSLASELRLKKADLLVFKAAQDAARNYTSSQAAGELSDLALLLSAVSFQTENSTQKPLLTEAKARGLIE